MPVWIVSFVYMHIDVSAKMLRNFEGNINVSGGIVHIAFTVWHTTDQITPAVHRLPHHLDSHWIAGQAQLRKGDQLNGGQMTKPFARRHHTF